MNETEPREHRAEVLLFEKTLTPEATGEYTLPDYNSEIKRLLWVRPTLLPPTRFIGNGRVDFSGPLSYEVLYTAPDGGLCSAVIEDHYAFSLTPDAADMGNNGMSFSVDVTPQAVTSRVSAPRKLSVKTRLRAAVRATAPKDLSAEVSGADGADVQYLWEMNESARTFTGGVETVEITDTIETQGEGELCLIASRGAALINEAAAASDGVRCRGEASLCCLLSRENAPDAPFTAVCRVPFEAFVPLDGVTPDCRAAVSGVVSDVHGEVEGDAVALRATLSLCAEAQGTTPVTYLRDVFAPGQTAACTTAHAALLDGGECADRIFTVPAQMSVATLGVPADAVPVDCTAEAEITGAETEAGRTVFGGQMHLHFLYRAGEEYGTAESSVPFRTVAENPCTGFSAACTVGSVQLRAERDRWCADCEICMALCTWQAKPVTYVDAARLTPAEEPARADIEICYPAAGETLWGVGKRYGVSPAALAEANGLDAQTPNAPDSLAGSVYLLIP